MNLLDWSSQTDKLAVGLGSDVYLWNQKTRNALKLFGLRDMNPGIQEGVHNQAMTPLIAADSSNSLWICNIEVML